VSAVSYCASLSSSQCANAYADDGTAICASNIQSGNCYAVVAQSGKYGNGGFDDGYNRAAHDAEVESQKLNAIVGVLGGLVAVLVLMFVGGGYFFYKKQQFHASQMSNNSIMMDEVTPHSMETDDHALMTSEH